jgi:hypothetical protein
MKNVIFTLNIQENKKASLKIKALKIYTHTKYIHHFSYTF